MRAAEQFTAFKTIVIKEVLRFARIWIQTILPAMVVTALYFLIFGELIGERIGEMKGKSYKDFIVPGLILMAVIQNSYANVVSSFYSSKFQRNIEELLVSPTPNYIILCGYIAGGVARGMTVGFFVALVAFLVTQVFARDAMIGVTSMSLLLAHMEVHNILVLLTVMLLTAILFSLAGLINGIFAKSFDDISIVPTFVLTPLTYLGGVFFTIDLLPGIWRDIAAFNPIVYMVNTFRYGLLGVTDVNITHGFLIIIVFIVALYLYSLYLLKKGVGLKE
jgi:ABC-2 type transport system permease protein